MAPKIYLFLFGWLEYSLANELVKVQNDIQNNISVHTKNVDCINKIVSKYLACGSNIKILSSCDDFSYLYADIKPEICYNVDYVYSKQSIHTHDGYIVYVTDIKTLHSTLGRLKKDKGWNPRAKYIVKVKDSSDDLEQIVFEIFLDLNIVDVILLKDKNDDIELLTYFSFGNCSCGDRIVNVTSFGSCNDSSTVNLFPNKVENNWRNCSVTVAVTEDPPFVIFETNKYFHYLDTIEGLEQYMLSNLGKREDISIDYIYVPLHLRYGVVLQNGSLTGSLVYLQNKTADIVAGAFLLSKNRAEVFDPIYGYSFPTIKVYTSAAREETWKNVYKPFGRSSWFLIILTFITFSAVLTAVSYLVTGDKDYVKIILRVFGYFYGNVDANLIRVTELRKFMIIWIFFALLICSFYNTAFYSVLTGKKRIVTPVYDKDYISSSMTPCIAETITSFYENTYNETLATVKSPDCRYIEDALDTVAKSRNLYTIYLDQGYKFAEYKYIDKDGNRMLDTWDYNSHYILSMYTVKGFPFIDLFRKYVDRFIESGLTQKQLNDIYFKSQLLKVNPVQRFKAVTLSDCRVHFGLLFLGIGLSTICFVIELNRRQINYAS